MKQPGTHPMCFGDSSPSLKYTPTCIYMILIWSAVFESGKAIAYEEFIGYPFETSNGYQLFPRGDDLARGVNIPFPFPYFNESFIFADISTNGYISLTNASGAISTGYTPMNFPLAASNSQSATLAPFWADVDTRASGRVVYIAVTRSENISLTSAIDSTVTSSLAKLEDFTTNWALIVTWDHVGYYSSNRDKLNTFQVVLATDGLKSVGIFNYAKDGINWVTGDANGGSGGFGGLPAVAGYNVGDGIRYFKFPGSLTEDIQFIDDISGNLGQQGQWVFRLDVESSILRTCQVDSLFLNTRIINSLGGDPILANYTCVEGVEEAFCIFNDAIEQPAEIVDSNQYFCSSPQLSKWGHTTFALRVIATDGTELVRKTTMSVVSPDRGAQVGISASKTITVEADEVIDISWSPTLLQNADPTSNLVDINIYELSGDGSVRVVHTLAKDIPNSGSAHVKIALDGSTNEVDLQPITPVYLQISLAKSHVTRGKRGLSSLLSSIALWSSGLLLRRLIVSASMRVLCEAWHAIEDPAIGEALLAETVCCPRTEREASWPSSGLQKETGLSAIPQAYFHPGADTCYRQATPREGSTAGQQCCYKSDGTLLVGPNSGGTVDRYAPVDLLTTGQHLWFDVIPAILCCKGLFSDCSKYYDRRPSHNGDDCSPTPPACVYGDPHIVTLDGHKYTFNGKGEFLLIEALDGSFVLQGRMTGAPDATNTANDAATVFSALVAKQNNSDTVQIELSDAFLMRINGDVYLFDVVNEETFNNVLISKDGNNSYSATFSSGIYIEVRVTQTSSGPYISTFIVSMPKSFKNRVKGLMGNYNGDISDDLAPKGGGDPLPLNSSLEELHWTFGVTWILSNQNDSLFAYDGRASFEDLYRPAYTPVFEANFTDPGLRATAEEMCQGNEYCLFDIAATADTSIGMATLAGVQELEAIINASWPVVCNPPCVHGACITNDSCSCSEGYIGERCTEAVVSSCSVNICGTGGSCSVIGVSSVCSCYSGYSGLFCEDEVHSPVTNVGAIVGGVLGSSFLCFLASVAIITFICCIKKRSKANLSVMYYIQDGMPTESQTTKTVATQSDCQKNTSTEACSSPSDASHATQCEEA